MALLTSHAAVLARRLRANQRLGRSGRRMERHEGRSHDGRAACADQGAADRRPMMRLEGLARRIAIFVGESDRYRHKPSARGRGERARARAGTRAAVTLAGRPPCCEMIKRRSAGSAPRPNP